MRGATSRYRESVCEKNSFRNSPSRLVRAISVISFGSSKLSAAGGRVFAESTSTGSFELERSKMRKLTSSKAGAQKADDLPADFREDDFLPTGPASFSFDAAPAWPRSCAAARANILLR